MFVKGHPNSPYIFADRPVHPDRKIQTSFYVIDKNKLEVVKTIQIPEKYLPSVKVGDKFYLALRGSCPRSEQEYYQENSQLKNYLLKS